MSENRGNLLIAPIAPRDINDTFPTHLEEFGEGGYRTVSTLYDRDNKIPEDRLKIGMIVNVLETGFKYELKSILSFPLTSVDWQIESIGGVIDIAGGIPEEPSADEIVHLFVTGRDFLIPSNFLYSTAKCRIAPTADYEFTIFRNEVIIGTFTFLAGSNTAIFTSIEGLSIRIYREDIIYIKTSLLENDITLSGIAWYLVGMLG